MAAQAQARSTQLNTSHSITREQHWAAAARLQVVAGVPRRVHNDDSADACAQVFGLNDNKIVDQRMPRHICNHMDGQHRTPGAPQLLCAFQQLTKKIDSGAATPLSLVGGREIEAQAAGLGTDHEHERRRSFVEVVHRLLPLILWVVHSPSPSPPSTDCIQTSKSTAACVARVPELSNLWHRYPSSYLTRGPVQVLGRPAMLCDQRPHQRQHAHRVAKDQHLETTGSTLKVTQGKLSSSKP